MSADAPVLVVDVLLEASDVLGYQRERALAWASGLGDELPRAVREATSARWLAALASVLDQRLVWARFRARVDDAVPERAAAIAALAQRGPDHPDTKRHDALQAQARSRDPHERDAAMKALREEYTAFLETDLGRGLAARATEPMLDARIDELRTMLDVDRMLAAWRAWPESETRPQRDERLLREALADLDELRAAPPSDETAMLWGAVSARATRQLSPASAGRFIAASQAQRPY